MIGNSIYKLIVIFTMVMLLCAAPVSADNAGLTDGLFGAFGQLYASDTASQTRDNRPAKAEFETIQGNDTPLGYILSHGNVIAGSESVTVAGSKLFRNVDYLIDYRSGSLSFKRPIRSTDAVRVSYRYAEGDSGERTVLSVPSLALASNDKLSLNFTYAYRAAKKDGDHQGADVATYGFNSVTKVGASSSLQSMLFVSNPQKTENRFSEFHGYARTSAVESKSDELIVQNADLGLGKLRLQLTYQDVGGDFQGFQALRDSRAADAGVLNQLEKEKGLKRLGVGLQFASASDASPSSLPAGLFWNSIQDKSGDFHARGVSFSSGKLGFEAEMRGSDASFQRMKDLTDAEKTDLALQIRRQFDPEATAQQVTKQDKDQVVKGAGIERSSYGLSFGSGSAASSLRMFTISDQSGDIQRSSFNLSGKTFNLSGFRQSIDEGFSRLADMTDVEKQRFGNERGMERLNLSGDMKIGAMQATMAFAKVDSEMGGVTKQSLGLTGKNFDLRANFQDIDASFTRIADLTDTDKKNMQLEHGYKRMDVSGKFSFSEKLSLQSFVYDAHNESQGLDRKQLRNQVVFTPGNGMKMSVLSDQFSFTSTNGNIDSYSRLNVDIERKFESGLFLRVSRDVLDRQLGDQDSLTTTTHMMHLETDASKKDRTFAVLDRKTTDFGNGKFEIINSVNIHSTISQALSVQGSYLDIDRGDDPSEMTNAYGLQWMIREGLALSASFMRKDTNNNQNVEAKSIKLGGGIFKQFAWFTDGKLTAEFLREEHNGEIKKAIEKFKFETLVAGGSMMMEYAGLQSADGNSPLSKAISFVSNRNPDKPIHFDFSYKYRDDGLADPLLIRAYNVDAKINENTKIIYSYQTYKEAADGKITPVGSEFFRLTSVLFSGYSLVAEYKNDENYQENRSISPISLGIAAKLESGAAFELGFGRSLTVTPAGSVKGNTYRLKYDQQVSPDNYINFSAALTVWDSTNPAVPVNDELEARLDYQGTFDW